MKLRVVGWTYYNNRFIEEGDKTAQFLVLDVHRLKDLTREELFKLREEVCDFSHREKSKRANETFKNAKEMLILRLKEKK